MTSKKRFALAVATALAAGVGLISTASAANITVTTFNDDYGQDPTTCSLREAITAANDNKAFGGCPAGQLEDDVRLPDGTYKITKVGEEAENKSGDFNVWGGGSLTVAPLTETDSVTIDANDKSRVFGKAGTGTLTLRDLIVTHGSAQYGGGVNVGEGRLIIDGSTLVANRAAKWGGGVAIQEMASGEVVNSTVFDNRAEDGGGGLGVANTGVLDVLSSTVVQNIADSDKDNLGNGGGFVSNGTVKMVNTILAKNVDQSPDVAFQAPDCDSDIGFLPRFVLSTQKLGEGHCAVGFDPGTNIQGDPLFDTYGLHGGTTYSWSLLPTSPAIDAAGMAGPDMCPQTDQHGRKRFALRCDIGSFEMEDSKLVVIHPPSPTDLSTDPVGSGTTMSPKVRGKAPAGTFIRIFSTADCTGPPLASGKSEVFAATGFPVEVARSSTTTFRAVTTNQENRNSLCSTSSAKYTQKDTDGGTGHGLGPIPGPTVTTATFDGVSLHVRLKCPGRFTPKCISRAVPVTARGAKGRAMGPVNKVTIRSNRWVKLSFRIKPAFRPKVKAMTKVDARRLVVRQRIRSKRIGKRKNRKQTTVFHTYKVRVQG